MVTVLKAIPMLLIIFSAIIGNLLVIISVFKFEFLQIISNSFIVSLAFADLLVALLVMPFNASQEIAGRWLFGQIVCDLWNANDVLFSNASLLHLCAISMDRYIAVTDPFHYESRMTKKRVALMLSCVWGASALISHIPIWTGIYAQQGGRYITEDGMCLFDVNVYYAVISSSISFWIPALIMAITYAMVFREAMRQERQIMKLANMAPTNRGSSAAFSQLNVPRPSLNNGQNSPRNGYKDQSRRLSRERNKLKREHKAAKTLGIIMSAFLLCWLPFFLWYLITAVCGAENCPYPPILGSILFWIGYFNSALNPMIYAAYNKEFNRAFKLLLHCGQLHRVIVNRCCFYCVKRGWIRRPTDDLLSDLPPARQSRPSISPSAGTSRHNSSAGIHSSQSSNNFQKPIYEPVPEQDPY